MEQSKLAFGVSGADSERILGGFRQLEPLLCGLADLRGWFTGLARGPAGFHVGGELRTPLGGETAFPRGGLGFIGGFGGGSCSRWLG